ncbi:MAG TPA: MFS transporter [Gaiellaceae bacterium]|nr:MFS transporter [Gaiellaceae bacterium]
MSEPSRLRSRPLVALLTAEAVSSLGSQMTFLALPWFVLVTTGSAAKMSIVLAVELLPVALLGIPSGALISRLGARTTMVVGDAARAPLMLAIPVLHEAGLLTFPLLLVFVFALGCFLAPYFSAQRLILPELVGDDERTVAQANAVVEGTQRATALLGPSLAGILIAVIGATNVLYLDAASYFASFLILTAFVPRRPPVAQSEDARGLLAGIRFLVRDPFLRVLGLTALVLNMFGQMLVASIPVLAFEEFDESSTIAGLFFASFGAGAVVGSVLALKLVPRYDPIRLGALSVVALTVPIPLLSLPLPAAAVIAVLFVSSVFGPLVNAPLIGVITMRTPEALRPKVMTGVITIALLAGPVGLLVVGPLLADWGPQTVLLCVGVGEFLATLPFAFVALRRDALRADVPEVSPAAGVDH